MPKPTLFGRLLLKRPPSTSTCSSLILKHFHNGERGPSLNGMFSALVAKTNETNKTQTQKPSGHRKKRGLLWCIESQKGHHWVCRSRLITCPFWEEPTASCMVLAKEQSLWQNVRCVSHDTGLPPIAAGGCKATRHHRPQGFTSCNNGSGSLSSLIR